MARQRRGQGEGSVYQRSSDGRWLGVVDLGRGPDGRRIRRTVSAATKAACLAKLRRLQLDTPGKAQHAAQPITVGEYLTGWLDSVRASLAERSWERYESTIRLNVTPYIGHIALRSLDMDALADMRAALARAKASPAKQRYAARVLGIALEAAVPRHLPRNPVSELASIRVEVKKMEVYSQDEVNQLLAAAKGHLLYPLIVTAVSTGMRLGELTGLYWQDVDLRAGCIQVQRALKEEGGRAWIADVKSKHSRRRIDLPQIAIAVLRALRASRKDDNPLVFVNTRGNIIRRNVLWRNYHRLVKRARLKATRFHDLRHTHATLLLLANVHPKIVSERLGHSSISVTLQIYSHFLPTMQQIAVKAMDDFLNPEHG